MGNKFNKKTNVVMRPPVCKSPPPPPHPEPPSGIPTDCCAFPIPTNLTGISSGSTCPDLNGWNVALTGVGGAIPQWTGSYVIPWDPTPMDFKLTCEDAEGTGKDWYLRWTGRGNSGVVIKCQAGTVCLPFKCVFNLRIDIAYQSPACGGGAARNFIFTISA